MTVLITAPRISAKKPFISSHEFEGSDNHVDNFDADERNDDSAETINQKIALQNSQRADGLIFHATQRQRNERDDDQGVENNRAQDCTLGTMQTHDIQRRNSREGPHETSRY